MKWNSLALTATLAVSAIGFLKAQKHDYYMTLGYESTPGITIFGGTDINFNTSPPTRSYVFRDMNFTFNAATICDEYGNLLFYTNGCSINGADNNTILNGDGLNPGFIHDAFCSDGYRAEQGSSFLPCPNNPNLYYLFHLGLNFIDTIGGVGEKFYYTLIDKNLNNGHGGVIEKNQILLEDTLAFGQITMTRHANGRDWWIIVPEMASPKIYIFTLTPYGLVGPTEQIIGNIHFADHGSGNAVFSPDGSKYARFDWYNQLNLFDFDRCTGMFSNPRHFSTVGIGDTLPSIGGVAFSPNSQFLYLSTLSKIFQYDTWESDIEDSKKLVGTFDGGVILNAYTTFWLPQLGPDGSIYICSGSAVPVMHVIKSPNKVGTSAQVIQRGLPLPTYNAWAMCFFPNFRLGPLDGSECDTLGLNNLPHANYRWDTEDSINTHQITFTDLSSYEPTSWHWDFGDSTVSNDANPTHNYTANGIYPVCLTVCNQYACDTICQIVNIDVTLDQINPHIVPLKVFPNPARKILNISLPTELSNNAYQVKIINLLGETVQNFNFNSSSTSINIDDLPRGLYVIQVLDKGKLVFVVRIIFQ